MEHLRIFHPQGRVSSSVRIRPPDCDPPTEGASRCHPLGFEYAEWFPVERQRAPRHEGQGWPKVGVLFQT